MSERPSSTNGDLYEQLVDRMSRENAVDPPAGPSLEYVLRHIDGAESQWRGLQRVVMGLLLVGVGLAILSVVLHPIVPWLCGSLSKTDMTHAVALPVLTLLGGVAVVKRRGAGAAMLLRALLWSSLLLGGLATSAEPGVLPVLSVGGALVSGTALLLLGENGLEPERYSGSFVPSAHREALTLIMILAMADAQTLVSWAQASRWYHPAPGVLGLVMTIGIIGLYRLRTWGLLFNAAANVGIASVALAGLLHLPIPVVVALTITAGLQLLLLVPVLLSIGAGEVIERPGLVRLGRAFSRIVIASIMVGTVIAISTISETYVAETCRH